MLTHEISLKTLCILAFLIAGLVVGCGQHLTTETTIATVPAPPFVFSTEPANGTTGGSVTAPITATFNKAMDPATITTSTFTVTGPEEAPVVGTVAFSGSTAAFTPTAVLAISTLYTATITTGARDTLGNALAAAVVWTFTTGTIPAVISTNPSAGTINVALNEKVTATFSEAMNAATVTMPGTFMLGVAGVGGGVPGTATYVPETNTVTFAPAANLLPSTQYTAAVNVQAVSLSASNSLAANFVWSFTTGEIVDKTSPQVVVTVPASGAIAVPTNEIMSATFSEPMDSATITAPGTVTMAVAGVGGAVVAGTVNYAGNTATFTPAAVLAASTQYTLTITTAAEDLADNALVTGAVPDPWSFTTSAATDTTAPAITYAVPEDTEIGVPLNKSVNATFSKSMDPVTILAPGTFTLALAGPEGDSVAGTVTYDEASRIATLTPLANLTAGTQYTAVITAAAMDLAGNPLASGPITDPIANPWSFTTGSSVHGQEPPTLGTVSTFGSFAGASGLSNTGLNTVISGNVGSTGASSTVTGFHDANPGCTYAETIANVGAVQGLIYTGPPRPMMDCPTEGTSATLAIATQVSGDANALFNDLSPASRPGGSDPNAGQLGGLDLPAGVFKAASGSFSISGGDLILDADSDASAVWVFQTANTLTVGDPGAPCNVILANGAQAKNVFWQVGTTATINAAGGGTMVGTIIAAGGVNISAAGNTAITTLEGRALGLTAPVTMANTVINVPPP
jgi:hypothetical protein